MEYVFGARAKTYNTYAMSTRAHAHVKKCLRPTRQLHYIFPDHTFRGWPLAAQPTQSCLLPKNQQVQSLGHMYTLQNTHGQPTQDIMFVTFI